MVNFIIKLKRNKVHLMQEIQALKMQKQNGFVLLMMMPLQPTIL
jgi:hypothetical protein